MMVSGSNLLRSASAEVPLVKEFQVVLLAAGKGSRMTELTAGRPKCLLPVGNQPMLLYPLRMLEKAGFKEVIIIVQESFRQEVQSAVDHSGLKVLLEWITIPESEDWGTAESFRLAGEKLKSDVIIVSCDLITDFNIVEAIEIFRKHQAAAVSVFLRAPPDAAAPRPGPKQKHRPERDLVGIDPYTSRLLFLASASDFEDMVALPRALIKKHPHISMYSQLTDSHIYILRKWVCDFLKVEKSFSTLKGEVIPYIVKKQLLKPISQITTDPNVSLIGVDVKKDITQFALEDNIVNEIRYMSPFSDHRGDMRPAYHGDSIRCYGIIADKEVFGMRINTLASYASINQKIHTLWNSLNENLKMISPTAVINSTQVGPECIIGDHTEIAEKTSLSTCIIGPNCVIQTKTRISNCILMNNVTIEEGCVLSNCVVCQGVTVGGHSELKECLLGSNHTVPSGAKHSNEVLTSTKQLMEI